MIGVLLLFLVVLTPGLVLAEGQALEQRITDAVAPLPASLRAKATVVLETEPGNREVLRQGTNSIICRADTPAPGFVVACHHEALDAFYTRISALFASGMSGEEIRNTIIAEVNAGKVPVEAGRTVYTLAGPLRLDAISLMAVYLPNATAESTGLSAELDHFRPWLMWAGTPVAHIMLPGQ